MSEAHTKKEKIFAPRGVPDYIPPQSEVLAHIRATIVRYADRAGYGLCELPIFEHTELFARGVGESTDVVGKEMYTFIDKGDRSVTLRPEGTAGVMRAIIENGLDKGAVPIKLCYSGPMFRYENPQAGRFRQFQTVGIEAVGVDDPLLDVETIAVGYSALRELGLRNFVVQVNSLGDTASRLRYRQALIDFLNTIDLDEATRVRSQQNPLRVLDDKREHIQKLTAQAPLILDYLSEEASEHFAMVRQGLLRLGIPVELNPRLVRGLDYYNKTTFEFVHSTMGSGVVLGGGGRYDGLLAELGGAPLSGVGFGMGLERIMLALTHDKVELPEFNRSDVFGVALGAEARPALFAVINQLRAVGVRADFAYGNKSVKAAMKAADRSGARYCLVMGDEELSAGKVVVRNMQSGEQVATPVTIAKQYLLDHLYD